MFDEELPKKTSGAFPRNLESMSIEELEHYIGELKEEIQRCEDDIKAKKASRDAAASIFN